MAATLGLLLSTLVVSATRADDGPALQGLLQARSPPPTTGGSAAGANATRSGRPSPETLAQDHRFYVYLQVSFAIVAIGFLVYHVVRLGSSYVRLLACLADDGQRFFARPHGMFGYVKEHVVYAPLFRKRHNRELQISAATNFGTVPNRFQTLFLVAYLTTNFALCVVRIDWNDDQKKVMADLRLRSGVLAVANMIPLFLLAGRNNPLIPWLGISFDAFNMIHRWFGRVVVLESVAHTLAYMISKVHTAGWTEMGYVLFHQEMFLGGTLGTIAFVIILFQSPSVIRHAFYETFLHLHIAMVALSLVGLWLHLRNLPQKPLVLFLIFLWFTERTIRLIRLVYRNVGRGGTRAVVQTMPGEAIRVTLDLARPWTFKPGQHVYLYVPSIGWWTSHPFSVAWSESTEKVTAEKGLVTSRQDVLDMERTSLSLIIRRRTGFTDRLYRKADASPDGRMTIRAMVEGPYGQFILHPRSLLVVDEKDGLGGVDLLHSYGTVMLFAAGIGITHQVPHVRDLLAGFENGTVAARKVVLVWIIQSPEHLEWIRPWMTTILAMERRREILRILLFVTRPRTTQEIHSPSATVQMFPGRPDVETLIELEMNNRIGAMAVTVCGTGSLSDDVRQAVRHRQTRANIDFVEEAFTW